MRDVSCCVYFSHSNLIFKLLSIGIVTYLNNIVLKSIISNNVVNMN